MTSKKKTYRRFIKYAGRLQASPEFARKSDADAWYMSMRRKKSFIGQGLELPDDLKNQITVIDFARDFTNRREHEYGYPKSTTDSDEQRFRDYILPLIGDVPMAAITQSQIKNLLRKICEPGYQIEGRSISVATRTRVKALLSAMFVDALNQDPPLVKFNPVANIKFNDPRSGEHEPTHIENETKIKQFMGEAVKLGPDSADICATFLMSGLRKQEVIAVRWLGFEPQAGHIRVTEKYEQASDSIKAGTKAGSKTERTVPIAKPLVEILVRRRKRVKFKADTDFIFADDNGNHLSPKQLWSIVKAVSKAAGLEVFPHALRHTFGRVFAENSGNVKALQAILGHSSSATTDLYSKLGGDRLKQFSEVVSFDLGVKRSAARHTKTQKPRKVRS